MAPTWTDFHHATRLVEIARGCVTAQRAVVATMASAPSEAVVRLVAYEDLLTTALEHLEAVRLNVTAARGNRRTMI